MVLNPWNKIRNLKWFCVHFGIPFNRPRMKHRDTSCSKCCTDLDCFECKTSRSSTLSKGLKFHFLYLTANNLYAYVFSCVTPRIPFVMIFQDICNLLELSSSPQQIFCIMYTNYTFCRLYDDLFLYKACSAVWCLWHMCYALHVEMKQV